MIKNILRQLENRSRRNILCMVHDEGEFVTTLCKTNNNFFIFNNLHQNRFNSSLYQRPTNLYVLDSYEECPEHITIDMVICNDRLQQYENGKRASILAHVPLIVVDHNDFHQLKKEDIFLLKRNNADINVLSCFSDVNHLHFDYTETIMYGIDTEKFKPKDKEKTILVIGQYPQEQNILNAINQKFGNIKIFNASMPPASPEDLIATYNKARIYLNLYSGPSLPMSLIYAMASECVVISNTNYASAKLLQNDLGIISTNPPDMINNVSKALSVGMTDMTSRARKFVNTRFPEKPFIQKWNQIFKQANKYMFKG